MQTNIVNITKKVESCHKLAESYDMTIIINRFIEDNKVSSNLAKEYEVELKKYLVMCTTGNYGMAGMVDDLWHTFVLHTKEYASFCESCLGEFIHHVPHSSKVRASGEGLKGYKDFIKDYPKFFGHKPPKHIWPELISLVGADAGNCNACGNDK